MDGWIMQCIILCIILLYYNKYFLFVVLSMCGIWAIFGLQDNCYSHCSTSFTKITHRGPDAWRVEYDKRIKVFFV